MSAPSLTNHTDYTKHRGVRHTKSGKWGAAIRHPITKVSVWLGSYNTPKEAADAYIEKKLEFGSMITYDITVQKTEKALSRKSCEPKVTDQAEQSNVHVTETGKAHSVGTKSPDNTDVANCIRRFGSVYRSNSGKWRAQISIRKTKIYLGTYATPEEAEAAVHKKRQDLDSLSQVQAAVAEELDPESCSKRSRKQKMAVGESVNGQVICSRPRGVYQRKSGRWFAEIRNPMTKVRGSVGTYETAEEALEALNRKRREYAEMKRKQSNAETELFSKCQDIVSGAGISEVLKFADMDDECGGSQVNVDSIIQVPCSSFVSNEEFGTSVINAYGELIGEFSRLDDELWFG